MIFPQVTYSLTALSESLHKYALLSGKAEDEILLEKGKQLGYVIFKGLRAIMPAKGSIRAEQLAALKSGKGVLVRPAVLLDVAQQYGATTDIESGRTTFHYQKGKTFRVSGNVRGLNLQALAVEREIAIRESGRGFSAYSVPKRIGDVESRYGFKLSGFTAQDGGQVKTVTLNWLGSDSIFYKDAVEGLSKSKQQKILAEAINEVNADIGIYIERKLDELIFGLGLGVN